MLCSQPQEEEKSKPSRLLLEEEKSKPSRLLLEEEKLAIAEIFAGAAGRLEQPLDIQVVSAPSILIFNRVVQTTT
jgi:hypothetical protein